MSIAFVASMVRVWQQDATHPSQPGRQRPRARWLLRAVLVVFLLHFRLHLLLPLDPLRSQQRRVSSSAHLLRRGWEFPHDDSGVANPRLSSDGLLDPVFGPHLSERTWRRTNRRIIERADGGCTKICQWRCMARRSGSWSGHVRIGGRTRTTRRA